MITQTGLPVVDVTFTEDFHEFWRVAGAVTSATAAAILLAYGIQPFIKLASLFILLAG
jgi:hypothetical protein